MSIEEMELSQSMQYTFPLQKWKHEHEALISRLFIYQDLLEMHNPACKQMASQSPRVSKGIQVKLLNLNKRKTTERPSPKVTDSVSFTRCTLWIPRCFIPRLQVAHMNKYQNQPSDGTTHGLFSEFFLRLPPAPPAIGPIGTP